MRLRPWTVAAPGWPDELGITGRLAVDLVLCVAVVTAATVVCRADAKESAVTALTRYVPPPVGARDIATLDAQIAKIATSALVPSAMRGKPADLMLIGLKARELGIDRLTVALQHIHSINSGICLSAQICVALARRGGHDLWVEAFGPESVTVAGSTRQRPDRVTKVTWTIEMSKTAGLDKSDAWKKYPQAMLFARASKDWVKMNCPEVMMGLDDGTFLVEDLVGLPDEGAPADVNGQVVTDGVIDVDPGEDRDDDPVVSDAWCRWWHAGPGKGASDEERHAVVHFATDGRVASLPAVLNSERDAVKAVTERYVRGDLVLAFTGDGAPTLAAKPAEVA